MPFTYKNRQIYFLIDHTFFNDAFRSDYSHTKDALWIVSYSIARRVFEQNEKILVVPQSILDIIYQKGKFSITQYIYTINKITNVVPIREKSPNMAIVKIALLLDSQEKFPIIVSSVNEDKWLERVQRIGLDNKITGFSKQMSKKRLINIFPAPIKKFNEAREMISKHDSLFKKINKKIHLN